MTESLADLNAKLLQEMEDHHLRAWTQRVTDRAVAELLQELATAERGNITLNVQVCSALDVEVRPVTQSVDAALEVLAEEFPALLLENYGEYRDAGRLTGQWLAQLGPRGPRKRLEEISMAGLQAVMDGDLPVSARTGPLALCVAMLQAEFGVKQP